jgi:Flp pilus assembly protein TadB
VTQKADTENLHPEQAEEARRDRRGNLFALEVCFLAFVGIFVLAAFVEALSYKLVSSRTPFVIMVPLIILIAIHARRLMGVQESLDVRARIASAFSGRNVDFNKVVVFCGWMGVLLALITVFGHLVAILAFCIILMRFVENEKWKLTLLVAAGTTLFVFCVFDFVFNIELYRGLLLRWYLGYRDF